MNNYQAVYEDHFVKNLARYQNMRRRIRKRVDQILNNPYEHTERLGHISGGINLKGCRSIRVIRSNNREETLWISIGLYKFS